MNVTTRFAPSPTGRVHIGNMRVAIYNWLFARHAGGRFLLRIEDTDRERSTPEAVRGLLEVMEWLGLDYDGEALYQSQRVEAHLEAAERLLRSGKAYRVDKGGTGRGEAVVFRMPGRAIVFRDEIKGALRKEADDLPDFVIVRSDGSPVFHLANVVDDAYMGVTHVIRGDDHVENTFRHVALMEALDLPIPRYAHLPMIVNAQGKPYSKRDGDAYAAQFREKGYLPEALFNYLVLLGWSPGDDREVMSREEIVRLFDLDRVRSAPSQMDPRKLLWMNAEYMRALPLERFMEGCRKELVKAGLLEGVEEDYFRRAMDLMRGRVKLFREVVADAAFFFTEDYHFDSKAVRKRLLREGACEHLRSVEERFGQVETFAAGVLEDVLRTLADEKGIKAAELIHPVRVAVSGLGHGPGLFEMLEVLGRQRVLERIRRARRTYCEG